MNDVRDASESLDVTSELWSLDWIKRLIEIDSTSALSNKPIIDVIAEELDRVGVEYQVFPSPDGKKFNLFATVPAADGSVESGIVLSGHSDVVPVEGQKWDSDPFEPVVRDGKLYGRGAADMKSFLGVALAAMPLFADRKLSRPVHLAVSFDEEVGCRGGAQLVSDLQDVDAKPAIAIIGEPSSMRVITAHKSINAFTVTFTGKSAHSSLTPSGVNAIEHAAQFIRFWREITEDWRDNGPFDRAYDVPFTTGGVNEVRGGTANNIVPAECTVMFEFRTIAENDPADTLAKVRDYLENVIEPAMKREDPSASVTLETISQVVGLDTSADSPAREFAHQLGGLRTDDKVAYATEAGQFQSIGIEAVVCGPGSIEQAHTANEFVELSQIVECEKFVAALAREVVAE